MLDDLRSALHRLDRQPIRPPKAFSSEADSGSRKETAFKKDFGASRKPN